MNHELEETVAELGTAMDSGTCWPASSVRTFFCVGRTDQMQHTN